MKPNDGGAMIDPEEIKDQAGLIEQLGQLRLHAGLSYGALADKAEVGLATVHGMIKGKNFPHQDNFLDVVRACYNACEEPFSVGKWRDAWIRADKARLRQAAFTRRWRRVDGGPEAGRLTALGSADFSHPLAVSPPPWRDGQASIRVGGLVGCAPLGYGTPGTSELRSRFLEFLAGQPVSDLVGALTSAGGLTWRSYAGEGRMALQAILAGDDHEAAPAAAALLTLPASGTARPGYDAQYAEFVLYVEPRSPDGGPAPAASLAAWLRRFTSALAVPAALAGFLARDIGLATSDDPPAQAGLWLTATHPGMPELVDASQLEAVPGSTPSSTFTGYVLADPAGEPAAAAARELLTQMCDLTLQLDEYEPFLEALLRRGRRAFRRPRKLAEDFEDLGLWGFLGLVPEPPEPPELRGPRARQAVGVSLGTTNSVVAVLDGDGPTVIPNREGSRTTPSAVALGKESRLYVGEAARNRAVGRTIRSVEHPMGTLWTFADDGRDFTPQQVGAHVLEKLIWDAEDYLIEIIASAVITVPAYFDDVQQQATREAARIAGLDVLEIIKEPAAAAFAYHLDNQEGATILVFDLGGSTLEVSLLEVRGGDVQIKATRRDDDLGGNDWDQPIADWLAQEFRNTHGTDLSTDWNAPQRLRKSAENIKIELSGAAATQVTLPYLSHGADGPLHLDTRTITRAEFQRLTSDLLDRCKVPFQQVIEDARIKIGGIDHIVLAGGSSQMPAVADLVRELTGGKEPNTSINPGEVGAIGASLRAAALKSRGPGRRT